ncbi:hypothetical protein CWI37_0961p0010 [Hamiltosporidium tvaerminnensis]|uniref:Uncharacterized protein n=1 Tax=Hamiltosporidium tvaerminnensis TaxID=1176355 RepID=A0A4Q9L0U0_9MICR|nr:hypothetical protein CWI37_0961p0010 [Hamiltosporidium tvaerminnensis]
MNLTRQEKLEFLHKLKSQPIDLTMIEYYLSHLQFQKSVLSTILPLLYDLDSQISALYCLLPKEQWKTIQNVYSTPLDDHNTPSTALLKQTSEKIRLFISSYFTLTRHIPHLDPIIILRTLDKSIHIQKTRNIQFILFTLCHTHPQKVLAYFIHKIKENYSLHTYIPYFCSLLVRYNFTPEISHKCINFLIFFTKNKMYNKGYNKGYNYEESNKNYDKGYNNQTDNNLKEDLPNTNNNNNNNNNTINTPNTNPNYILLTQFLLYICCFKKEYFTPSLHIITHIFKYKLYTFMNKNIIKMFCKIYNYKTDITYTTAENETLWFPFDPPIIDEIINMHVENYIVFNKKNI